MKYTAERQPSVEELDELHKYFVRMAGDAEARAWEDLYLDAADVLADVVAAWRNEIEP